MAISPVGTHAGKTTTGVANSDTLRHARRTASGSSFQSLLQGAGQGHTAAAGGVTGEVSGTSGASSSSSSSSLHLTASTDSGLQGFSTADNVQKYYDMLTRNVPADTKAPTLNLVSDEVAESRAVGGGTDAFVAFLTRRLETPLHAAGSTTTTSSGTSASGTATGDSATVA